jgi:hypothetical protein
MGVRNQYRQPGQTDRTDRYFLKLKMRTRFEGRGRTKYVAMIGASETGDRQQG